ncbi:MAG TPA: hypothetical protein PK629_06665 [Oscillospiraceae bacterium]|nr:hypothetical protein [Oscillospiraceae bacterium]HPF55317.1 hypothetical protein [Clostridiales bacterium]HPK36099.1 hypothetical protein [Oscillospiraceae bacterium]HPR76614.1 hypothetical protein [Oscillospiraceae bacterium]
MKSVFFLCVQDFKRLLTNALFWVLAGTLVVIVLVVNLALPSEIAPEEFNIVTYNLTNGALYGEVMDSEEALREAVSDGGMIGLIGGSDGLTVVHPGLSEKTLNAVMLMLSGAGSQEISVEILNAQTEVIPFNLRISPIFICFEALLTGFILGGALMLAEKEDGTVNVLRISPTGTARYLISKSLLFSVIGTLYATLICVFTIGFDIAWDVFLPLAFFGTLIFTLIGLAYTTLFHEMSGWFFSMVVLLGINMLPVISYTTPAFSPLWMKFIPSYPILFAFQKSLFGGTPETLYTILSMVGWLIISYLIASLMVSKLFLKEVRA